MNGLIPLNKPRGMTSADCVYHLRKILHERRIGHTGTLDPDVDGVLPICVGQATKLVDRIQASGKRYRGEITLGFATTTEDISGEIIDQLKLTHAPKEIQIDASLHQLTGTIQQIPPMFSAVKVNGRRLYEYARAGEAVERPVRTIEVSEFRRTSVLRFDAEAGTVKFNFVVACSKGTYVRTLATDCGRNLGVPAVMSDLTREESGHIQLNQTVTLEEVQQAVTDNRLATVLEPIEKILSSLPQVNLNESQWQKVKNGNTIFLANNQPEVVLNYQHHVKAIYHLQQTPQGNYVSETMMLGNE